MESDRDLSRLTGNPEVTQLGKSFAWAWGPPIDMKIEPSRVYDQAGVGRQRSWQLWVK